VSHGITVYPFLWSHEAHQDLAGTSRRPAPMAGLFSLKAEFAAQFAANPATTAFKVRLVQIFDSANEPLILNDALSSATSARRPLIS
jgi:hypothetical protein